MMSDITQIKILQLNLMVEAEKNERLIKSMLPESILERIRNGEEKIADYHENVCVGFCDIVNFTPMVQKMTPLNLCNFLDNLFTDYDNLAEKLDVYKVETAGDNYMICCGLFGEKDYTEKCVQFMWNAIKIINEKYNVSMRAGLHSGPVASGVIGKKNPHLNIFGDTVNVASRMESHSETNKIQITKQVLDQLDVSKYNTTPNYNKQIKGKGKMNTFFITKK